MSRWLMALFAAAAFLLAIAGASEAAAQPAVLCKDLTPGEDHPFLPAGARCIERDRISLRGRQYLFAEIVGFRSAGRMEHVELARDAVTRAVETFSRWYQVPDALIIFSNESSDPRRFLGITAGDLYGCVVMIDDSALRIALSGDTARNQLLRTIAHEIFHCVQYEDRAGMGRFMHLYEEGIWWIEGSAEYFAGLAIPESRPGASYYSRFSEAIVAAPLYRAGEDAYAFFAFLKNERGADAVAAMLRAIDSRLGGHTDSIGMLRSIPDVDGLFLALARAVFDGTLADDQGRSLGLGPPEVMSTDVGAPINLDIGVEPFRISGMRLRLAPGLVFEIAAPAGANNPRGQLSEDPRVWRDLPARAGKCLGSEALLIAVSTQDSEGAASAQVRVSEPADRYALAECPCPLGRWSLDQTMLLASGVLQEGRYERGAARIEFRPDGTGVGYFDNLTGVTSMGENVGAIRTVNNTRIEWTWARRAWSAAQTGGPAPTGPGVEAFAVERILTANRPSYKMEFLDKRGSVIREQTMSRPTASAPSKSIHGAVCAGDTLQLIGGASSASRVSPGDIERGLCSQIACEDPETPPSGAGSIIPLYTGTYRR